MALKYMRIPEMGDPRSPDALAKAQEIANALKNNIEILANLRHGKASKQYSSIPSADPSFDNVMATILACRINVEILTGHRGTLVTPTGKKYPSIPDLEPGSLWDVMYQLKATVDMLAK